MEEIEAQELELLQKKSSALRKLLVEIEGIMDLAKYAKRDAEHSQRTGDPITRKLHPTEHNRLTKSLVLVMRNLEEEIELARDIAKKEEKRRE